MRILGVDPGLTRCGLGVIEAGRSRTIALVDVSVARSSANAEVPDRLASIADAFDAALNKHQPDAVALERVFAQHNVRTVMGTAQISGVVMATAARRGIPVALYTPSEVKAAVTGSGRADKAQVSFMVAKLLGLDSVPGPADAADALAIAIAHAWRGGAGPTAAGPGNPGSVTPAQRRWAEAEKAARKRG
ncbi:crossover junction endodeoxyribonuclease RuvC [Demequina aurantiaca]|uniref:crossover junction endodeoxyribonuclease RuvC n=1 Tax=Demequina aurantiaca TaxID=676200 RepID=UPI000784068B|nr:crossover junction endodeoxyribonuclease RuvC [Demequina aurantiaca]